MAVYGLSFWHYYLYWLAYSFGAISLTAFKGDAIFMKSVSIIGLGWAYFGSSLNLASLALVMFGFALNTLAAKALGSDRTYYGYEVAGLQRVHITSFPYSWVSHPMLIGNIAAFGGTMINAEFRATWWPLASAHVLFNIGLLVMETVVVPARHTSTQTTKRGSWPSSSAIGFGTAIGGAVGAWLSDRAGALCGAATGIAICSYIVTMHRNYSGSGSAPAADLCESPEINSNTSL